MKNRGKAHGLEDYETVKYMKLNTYDQSTDISQFNMTLISDHFQIYLYFRKHITI